MIFCGFWTDKGTCDENVASFLGSLKQQRVFLFGTAGFGGDPAYFEKILNTVKQCLSPSVSLCGGFLCQGKCRKESAAATRQCRTALPANPCWKTLTVPCLIPTHRTWNPCAPPSAKRSQRTHKARFLSPKGRCTAYRFFHLSLFRHTNAPPARDLSRTGGAFYLKTVTL